MLLAIAGPNYEWLFADVGTNGRMNDSGIWNKSSLRRAIENREIELSEPRALPYCLEKIPFVILGDDGFALKNYMIKPNNREKNLQLPTQSSKTYLGKHVWYPRKSLESITYNNAFES